MTLELFPGPMDNLVTLGLRYLLIDVREDHECTQHPIVSDYHIPLSRFDPSELHTPQSARLLVICDKGQRSLVATVYLRQKGWSHSYSLGGGISKLMSNHAHTARSNSL